MTDCYIYTRVSSQKQVREGDGLKSQKTRCLNYAKANKYKVINNYSEEGVSGQLLYRPVLEQLFKDLESNKKEKILLVDSSSRLTRSLEHSLYFHTRLNKLSTKLVTVDMSVPEGINGELMRNMITAFHQYEAQSNQLRVFHRMHACMQNQRYIFRAPFGYESYKDAINGKMIRPDGVKSLIAKELLEKFASNQIETVADAQRFLSLKLPEKNNNYTYRNKQALRILRNSSLYAGLIIYNKEDKKLVEKKWSVNTKGLHKPIISVVIHNKIQDKLNNPKKIYKTKNAEIFVLKGSLKCNGCGGNMTSNFSRSKSGRKIGYYRCNNFKCTYEKKNVNQRNVESFFDDYLNSISFDMKYSFVLEEVIKTILNEISQEIHYEKRDLKIKIKKLQEDVSKLVDKLSQEKFENIYEDIIRSVEKKKKKILELESNYVKEDSSDKLENYLPEFLSKFRNLADHWKSLEPKYKRDLNGLVFPNGFSFTLDEKITTPKLSIPFNDYRENFNDKSNLVEPRGIEPLTSTLPA